MAVLNTTSPLVARSAPNELPQKRLPSSSIRVTFFMTVGCSMLVGGTVSLVETYVGFIDHSDASGRGIVACEIPITRAERASSVQAFDALENDLYGGSHFLGTEHEGHLLGYFVGGEWLVDGFDGVLHFVFGLEELASALFVCLKEDVVEAFFFEQLDCGAEGYEFVDVAHVYAVEVGVAYLWGA